jgi:hypothetical protein
LLKIVFDNEFFNVLFDDMSFNVLFDFDFDDSDFLF